jgi:hypothetical protein
MGNFCYKYYGSTTSFLFCRIYCYRPRNFPIGKRDYYECVRKNRVR